MEMEWRNRQRQTLQESAIREAERVENAGDLNAELGVSLSVYQSEQWASFARRTCSGNSFVSGRR
jgi:hypothetical protein